MEKITKQLYLNFYNKQYAKFIKYGVDPQCGLFDIDGVGEFVRRYIVKSSVLYIRYLEYKSKEAREIWGKEIVKAREIKR